MIRQQAFINKNKMLKGNLHCHTTRSDGAVPPEEAVRIFKENGYDFLAITDHKIYNFSNFAPGCEITIIPGMEFDAGRLIGEEINGFRTFHTVCIGPSKADGNGFEQDQVLESAKVRDQIEYQPYLDEIHQMNNLTVYCHPEWSSTPARYFDRQQGNFAVEIWNTGCALDNDMDYDAPYWDELLGRGIHIFGVASDDCHKPMHFCKGWVMVNAENNINDILRALNAGEFYSSCGPVINDFYVDEEKGKVVIECSPVQKIRLHSDKHPTVIVRDENGNLTHAEIPLSSWVGDYDYVRMSVVDRDGKYAWTNPIFLK